MTEVPIKSKNQKPGFYKIGTSVTKELKGKVIIWTLDLNSGAGLVELGKLLQC